MAVSSTAYDILNHMSVDTYLGNYRTDERTIADRHLEKIRELSPTTKDILLMDRGYLSIYLLVRMVTLGYDFIVRFTETTYLKEVSDFVQSKETDEIIEIDLTTDQRKKYRALLNLENKPDRLRLRVVKIKLTSGLTEYIISSLTDRTKITKENLKELYHLRWGEETYFNFQKNVLEMEILVVEPRRQ